VYGSVWSGCRVLYVMRSRRRFCPPLSQAFGHVINFSSHVVHGHVSGAGWGISAQGGFSPHLLGQDRGARMSETLDLRLRVREGSYELRGGSVLKSQHNVVDEFRLLAYSRCKDTKKRSLTLAVHVKFNATSDNQQR
jgi:hypothetical protein